MAEISKALAYVLKNEGGGKFTMHPRDPGGATKWGITRATLAEYRGRPTSSEDVRRLTVEEAEKIYRLHYWVPCHLDEVEHQGVATAIFDCAVNRGVGVAQHYESVACYKLGASGINAADPALFLEVFAQLCEQGYKAIVASKPRLRVFLKGWLNRARRLLSLKDF